MSSVRNWPYAAKAVVQHQWDTNHLDVWVTFRHPMNQTVKPANGLWLCEADSVAKNTSASAWQDAWTLLLTVDNVMALPGEVTLEYNGPDDSLITTWNKQWEPWGPILSLNVPYDWEDVLTVDIANQRVGILDTTPSQTLDVNGAAIVHGLFTCDDIAVDGNTLTVDTVNNDVDLINDLHLVDLASADLGRILIARAAGGDCCLDLFEDNIVWGTNAYGFRLIYDGGTNKFHIQRALAISVYTAMTILRSNGYVGINDTTPSYQLDVNGDIRTQGDFRSADGSQGWTGTFTEHTGKTVTVKNGIITSVV